MHRDWQSILLRLAVLLAALLIVLASFALLDIFFQVLRRFGNVVVLFTLGAIVAYVLHPAVNRATAMLAKRWAGMLAVYGGVTGSLAILTVLLFQPLLSQSSSLVSALHNPSARSSTATLASDYWRAVPRSSASARESLTRSLSAAGHIALVARVLHRTVSATPILLLDAQVWADQHHLNVNVRSSAGQAVRKVTDQAASILNNTTSILTTTGTLLVDAMLILLISLYFVSDGARMIRRGLELVPDRYHNQATFFVDSMDYLRITARHRRRLRLPPEQWR